jgi:hypothetical protein
LFLRQLTDPVTNTNNLNARLKSLGLYAANTVGDGNCLFRALSDQLYGSPAKHLELRQEICNFIEARKDQYAGFIEDDRGIETHLANMRIPGSSIYMRPLHQGPYLTQEPTVAMSNWPFLRVLRRETSKLFSPMSAML